jgi:acyl-ACP thioesterase
MTVHGHGDHRRYTLDAKVRLGDVTPRRRMRLDAFARYLQDVASDDDDDAALPGGRGWILRRTELEIGRLPGLAEAFGLETRCTGVGPGARWAERTTTLADASGAVLVTSRAVWVYVDLATGAPCALPPEFFAVYGRAVRAHRVSARLTLPRVDDVAPRSPWPIRRTDLDVYGHVNNAAYWHAVEDRLGGVDDRRRIRGATIEFGGGIEPHDLCELAVVDDGAELRCWFLVGAETRATARVVFEAPPDGR